MHLSIFHSSCNNVLGCHFMSYIAVKKIFYVKIIKEKQKYIFVQLHLSPNMHRLHVCFILKNYKQTYESTQYSKAFY